MKQVLLALGMVGAACFVTGCVNHRADMNVTPHMAVISDCTGPSCVLDIEDEDEVCYGCTVPIE